MQRLWLVHLFRGLCRSSIAIDHGVRLQAFKCLRDFYVGVTDNLPVTAVERDSTAPDFRDYAETIEFVLEDPIGIVEG